MEPFRETFEILNVIFEMSNREHNRSSYFNVGKCNVNKHLTTHCFILS